MIGNQQLAGRVGIPKLRGWLHAGLLPLVVLGGVALVAFGESLMARIGDAIYFVTSAELFGVSAVYHIGRWTEHVKGILKRLDHANIYLLIAGTYTPIALLSLRGDSRIAVMALAWSGALAGVVFRVFWVNAPRFLYTVLYAALGWAALFFIPQLVGGAGIIAFILIMLGGLFYSVGGVMYALRKPNPSPKWFGFHEMFHTCTILAYISQYVAISMITYRFS
ncbi:MAG: hemolysin III family protein [Actinobacteria bacterium]|nr:hemolysin III family protein [Actinomycetota bacterium]MCL5447580.1 hemolysin III family protein [Actinomycetota bacterium]